MRGYLEMIIIKNLLRNFLKDESGQATTEYVLLIAILVSILLTLAFAFKNKIQALFQGRLGNYLREQFFNPRRMYRFPINIPR